MEQLELDDIQGFLVREYKEFPFARYLLLAITAPGPAKRYIGRAASAVTSAAASQSDEGTINIGFTAGGLTALGLHPDNVHAFTREFREGMVTPHRQRLLGDQESSDPLHWNWGGPNNASVHLVVMLFSSTEERIERMVRETLAQCVEGGLSLIQILQADAFPDDREHFGFRDGISQPAIAGSGVNAHERDQIRAGEFVLGYRNEYGVHPDTPVVKVPQGNMELLAPAPSGTDCRDLGRNGTYFVLRQLKEDVDGFWQFLNDQTRNADGSLNPEESTRLAAKMMGRWPSGAPLVKFPDSDPGGLSDDNDFVYTKTDKLGLRCPFGAHTRRTNPRDNFEETGPAESLNLTRKHRIMRRVRSYGEAYVGSATHHAPHAEVGLFFGCFNADINRQFEFIQYTWANYPKFKQLYADPDPFIGVKETPPEGVWQQFTIPTETHNRYVEGLKSFVTVRGGAYFFFPSISVLKYLGTL